MMLKRTVRSDFGEVSVRETGVLIARVYPDMHIDLQRAKEYHSLVSYLSKNRPHTMVIDITSLNEMSPEARIYLQETSSKWGNTVAVALISNSITAKVISNFFLSINKPTYPVKVFANSLEAHLWSRLQYRKRISRKAS